MSDRRFAVTFWLIFVGVVAVLVATASDASRRGYRRGFCEGRGGVEATVGDSIRCIRPPLPVDTTMKGAA